jgi:hypothetical protein
MLRLRAEAYIRVGESIKEMEHILYLTGAAREHGGGPEDTQLDENEAKWLKVAIRILLRRAALLRADTSLSAARRTDHAMVAIEARNRPAA